MNLEGLEQFATGKQAEYLEALKRLGSNRKVAQEFGVVSTSVDRAINGLKKKAALHGWSPQHDMIHIVPDGFNVKGVSTYYNKDGKPSGQWVKSTVNDAKRLEMMQEAIEVLIQDIKPTKHVIEAPMASQDELLSVYPMGDPHFGMYAWWEETGNDFDLKIAEDLTCSAIDRLVSAAPPSKNALLLNLGDMFHADNQKNLTNSGHQLDVDGRWTKVQQVGLRAMVHCIFRLLEKHEKVKVRINKGNHDGHSSYALALMLDCYFRDEKRVSVDLSPSIAWFYKFGKVLIGSTHGDTIKEKDLVPVMAADMPKEWGETVHRYWYVGHIHHQLVKEYAGGVVEYFRTLAAKDAWHAGQGYRAGRDMRLIVHHKEHGEIERHRVDVGML